MQVIKSGENSDADAAAASKRAGADKTADADKISSLGATSTPSRSKVSIFRIEPLNSLPVHLLAPLISEHVSITVDDQSVP